MAIADKTGRKPGATSGPRRRAKTAKVTVTIPVATLEAATARVRDGFASSLSSYVSQALATQVAADSGRDALVEFLDHLDQELGPPGAEDNEWARRVVSSS
jgi:hypothetical protein